MAKLKFEVKGEFALSARKLPGGRRIDEDQLSEFWSHRPQASYRKRTGCYVFAIRAALGFKPWYVGMTARSFEVECFTDRNIKIFNEALASSKKGTPVLLLVAEPMKRGKANKRVILQVEKHLINEAWAANADLLNYKGKKARRWEIQGLTTGKPSKSARALRRMLNHG